MDLVALLTAALAVYLRGLVYTKKPTINCLHVLFIASLESNVFISIKYIFVKTKKLDHASVKCQKAVALIDPIKKISIFSNIEISHSLSN